MLFVLFLSCIALANAHMSMSFPVPRSYGRVSRTDCTSAKRAQKYLTWEWNEPMVGVRPCICHGTFPDATVPAGNVFPAGSTITVKLAGSAFHNGGHCSFWWSTDGKNFKKFVDYKDCTTDAVNNRPINIVVPKGVDTACGTRCIFAWTWVPVSSGACEVYMTCADVQITGATGGFTPVQTKDFSTVTPSTCVRVNNEVISSPLFCPATYGTTCTPATSSGTTTTTTTSVPITAAPQTTTTQGTGTNSPIGALCINPSTPTTWGNINNQNGRCGNGVGSCDVGHCCSAAGFCGPDLRGYSNGLPQYINYTANSAGTVFYPNAASAFADYCNAQSLADFRQVPCCAIVNGQYNSNLNSCLKNYTPLTTATGAPGATTTGTNTVVPSSNVGYCASGWMAVVAAFVGYVLV